MKEMMEHNQKIPKNNIEDLLSLTPLQEGMLFHYLKDPESDHYVEQLSLEVSGEIDTQRFERAWNDVSANHEMLRTVFRWQNLEKPIQIVLKEHKIQSRAYDFSTSPVGQRKRALEEVRMADRKEKFALGEVPFRITLCKLEEDKYEMMISHHHILFDGWSYGIILQDFFKTYDGLPGGKPLPSTSPKKFRGFIQELQNQDTEKQQQFWTGYLKGIERPTRLSIKRRKAGEDAPGSGSIRLVVPTELSGAGENFARKYQLTPATLLYSAWGMLFQGYNNCDDVILGTTVSGRPTRLKGIENMVGLFINTVPLRVRSFPRENVIDFLHRLENERKARQEYETTPLVKINAYSGLSHNEALFDTIIVLENYPLAWQWGENSRIRVESYAMVEKTHYDLTLGIKTGTEWEITIQYRQEVLDHESVWRLSRHFTRIFQELLANPRKRAAELEMITAEEKQRLLYELNQTQADYPRDKTLHQLFAEEAEKTPGKIAVSFQLDLAAVYRELTSGKGDQALPGLLENCCFEKNPYVFAFTDNGFLTALNLFHPEEVGQLTLLRTHRDNYAAVNEMTRCFLDSLEGKTNLKSIWAAISNKELEFWLHPVIIDPETGRVGAERRRFRVKDSFADLVKLVKALYGDNLIELVDYHSRPVPFGIRKSERVTPSPPQPLPGTGAKPGDYHGNPGPVLLLGDRAATATTGLLYIASYLRRKGIEAYCQWNDFNKTTAQLKANIETLLTTLQPKVVGVSMKWFPHMARALEIGKIVKTINPLIQVVLGGNTASYYKEEIIRREGIDYVVAGDGEVPFLKICRGEKDIPNAVYKKGGKVVVNPITYVQDETDSKEIFFSHLEEIFVSPLDPYLAPYIYINTGKGCSMQCCYCGGCRDAQIRAFNRVKPFMRGVEEVRKDIVEAKKITSTFWFDFDLPTYDSLDYYKKIWEGVDLSNHFCEFYFWKLPKFEFLDFVVKVFKYVYINIDVCSLSQPHRLKLSSLGLVKPQPTDAELVEFFDRCEKYNNIEVIINHITGLPHFTTRDIEISGEMISRLVRRYSCFKEMDWGRLHAQPGAPLVETCGAYDMHSYAKTYEDFLSYSELNLKEEVYPELLTYHYPYIYSNDETLNSKITQFYVEATKRVEENNKIRRQCLNTVLHLTYEQLNRKSTQLAAVLRERGVKPGSIVALYVQRSLEMIIGLLAVLKAGAAYLPLGPGYPANRNEYMLRDSHAPIILTRADMANQLSTIAFNGNIIHIDDEEPDQGDVKEVANTAAPHSPAYVLYTSGSTGKPKGVVVSHRNVLGLVKNPGFIVFSPGDKLLLTGALVFDITTFEIWSPLLNSFRLFLADQNLLLDAEKLEEILSKNEISVLHLIPQLFNQLASQSPEIFAGLKYLLVGGDIVRPLYVNRVRKHHKHLKILHMYGPTENTTFSTCLPVEQDYDLRIPIGTPISNSSVYIMNKYRRLLPVGVAGELWVGGEGVAPGYLNQPELTAEKFINYKLQNTNKGVPFPQRLNTSGEFLATEVTENTESTLHSSSFTPKSARRAPSLTLNTNTNTLYRTGDLTRWRPDGNIEFLGREDHQVKIRGIRIELGEIESVLLSHEDIREAVVLAKTAGGVDMGDHYLVAYLAVEKKIEISPLREYLAAKLPDPMLPAFFVQLHSLPLTSNGKINRQALPEPGISTDTRSLAPRSEVEKKLAGIWMEILGIEKDRIGIDSNFFELGGHSLKITTLASRIYKTFGVKIPYAHLLRKNTIRELAGDLQHEEAAIDHYSDIESCETKEYYPLSSSQKRLYILQQMRPGDTRYNLPALYSLGRGPDKSKLETAFKALSQRHESLRTSFTMVGQQPVQIIRPRVELDICYYEGIMESELEAISRDFLRPFSLSHAPLLRVGLVTATTGETLLLVDMHHIIMDGFSLGIFLNDFNALYEGRELPALRLQYNDFARWQNDLLAAGGYQRQAEYWLNQFKSEIPELEISLDFPRPEARTFAGDILYADIDEELCRQVKEYAKQMQGTSYMVLAAVYNILLAKYSGQEDIVVGSPITGRSHPDLENILANFVNLLPIRNYPRASKTVAQFSAEVRENALNAFKNQDYPFDRLVIELGAQGNPHRNPLFDTVFVLQDFDSFKEALEDKKIKPHHNPTTHVKFDLMLSAVEHNNKIQLSMEYSTELFTPTTIEKMLKNYLEILEQAMENKEIRIKDLRISHELVVADADLFHYEESGFDFK